MRVKKLLVAAQIAGMGLLMALPGLFAQPVTPSPEKPTARIDPQRTVGEQTPLPKAPQEAAEVPYYWLVSRPIDGEVPKTFVWDVQPNVPTTNVFTGPQSPRAVFPSLKSADLRGWVALLPKGTVILFPWHASGAMNAPKNPIPPDEKLELDDFTQYCKTKGVIMSVSVSMY
jgi:hypothetical protein